MPAIARAIPASREKAQSESVSTVLQLEWEEGNRPITVTPKDNDKFVSSVHEAIEACKAYKEQVRFTHQYEKLMKIVLPEWIRQQDKKIKYAIMTLRESRLLFIVIRKRKIHDEELESALIDLDLSIARDPELHLIKLSVLDIPNCTRDSIAGFLDCNFNLWYYHASKRRPSGARR